ncbi:MAG: DUF3795 domain-containing protein [Eubacterium sp.]|nr:DUF3795 domain-containing protein [Eubacterium sp.]
MSITDFSLITPCGGNCTTCGHFRSGECGGCLNTHGKCVKMWENDCKIYSCCKQRGYLFCGLCPVYPCELFNWQKDKEHMRSLVKEYNERKYI